MFRFQSGRQAAMGGEDWQVAMRDATAENMFTCPYPGCGHSFVYKHNLNVHQRKKHGGIYGSDQCLMFFCRAPNCGRSFYSKGALAKHRTCVHHEESLYG